MPSVLQYKNYKKDKTINIVRVAFFSHVENICIAASLASFNLIANVVGMTRLECLHEPIDMPLWNRLSEYSEDWATLLCTITQIVFRVFQYMSTRKLRLKNCQERVRHIDLQAE